MGPSGHRVDLGGERKAEIAERCLAPTGEWQWGPARGVQYIRGTKEENLINSMWGRKVNRQTPRLSCIFGSLCDQLQELSGKFHSIHSTPCIWCIMLRKRWKIRKEEGLSPKEMYNLECSMTGLHVPGTWHNASRSSKMPAQARHREMK